jgi:hypothetical protein
MGSNRSGGENTTGWNMHPLSGHQPVGNSGQVQRVDSASSGLMHLKLLTGAGRGAIPVLSRLRYHGRRISQVRLTCFTR